MQPDVHAILMVLGDGGTTDMAQRVVTFIRGGGNLGCVPIDDIISTTDVANLAGCSVRTIPNWRRNHSFPAPFKTVAGVDLYDLAQVRTWTAGHPELVPDA